MDTGKSIVTGPKNALRTVSAFALPEKIMTIFLASIIVFGPIVK